MNRHFSKSPCPRYIQINNCHNNPFRGCLLSFTGAVLFTLTSNSPQSLDYRGSLRWDRQALAVHEYDLHRYNLSGAYYVREQRRWGKYILN